MKAIHTMACVLIKKAKKNVKKERPFGRPRKKTTVGKRGEIKSLLLETETIQQRLTSNNDPKNVADVLKKLAKLMGKGNINGALKLLLTNNVTNGIPPLDEKTLNFLK